MANSMPVPWTEVWLRHCQQLTPFIDGEVSVGGAGTAPDMSWQVTEQDGWLHGNVSQEWGKVLPTMHLLQLRQSKLVPKTELIFGTLFVCQLLPLKTAFSHRLFGAF